jgi:DNA-binding NarL/FixJ family response regulator
VEGQPMRILIADDHPVVRSGLRAILGTRKDWEVCAEATTGDEAIALARKTRPDIVITDLNMPGIGGFDAAAEIKRSLPGVELIVLTCHYSKTLLYEVMKLGALGFVLKSDAERDLIAAVESVWHKEPYISRNLDALLPNSPRTTPLELLLTGRNTLTKAERAEVRSIADQMRQLL